MRQKVLQVASEMQYRPNVAARTLSTSRTYTVLFIVHHRQFHAAVDPFYPYIMHGLEERLSSEGYSVVLMGPDISPGFIIATANLGLPALLVDNALQETPFPVVLADNVSGCRAATNHLICEHRHQYITLLRGPERWVSCEERATGYLSAITAAGLEPHVVKVPDTTLETG